MRPRDTAAEVHAVQIGVYRRLGPSRRAALAAELSADARRLTRAGILARHPEYNGDQVDSALWLLLYGEETFRRAWPGRPLLPP